MTRRTAQLLNAILLVSGLIHITGLLKNWKYDFYVGLFLTVTSGLWFVADYFRNGKTFSTKNNLVIKTRQIKWWRIKEVFGTAALFFLLVYGGKEMGSILITFIIYFLFMVILDHTEVFEITDNYIIGNGIRIKLRSFDTMDFKQNQIIIRNTNDIVFERRISLAKTDPAGKKLIMERLIKGHAATAQQNA